jgi:ribosomal protein S4
MRCKFAHPNQDQLEDMKKKEASDQKLMLEVNMENKRLSEPLQKALKEVEHLRHELQNYTKDKESLQLSKAKVKVLENELKNLKWSHEVLEQRFQKVMECRMRFRLCITGSTRKG